MARRAKRDCLRRTTSGVTVNRNLQQKSKRNPCHHAITSADLRHFCHHAAVTCDVTDWPAPLKAPAARKYPARATLVPPWCSSNLKDSSCSARVGLARKAPCEQGFRPRTNIEHTARSGNKKSPSKRTPACGAIAATSSSCRRPSVQAFQFPSARWPLLRCAAASRART
jgi:hypothetical protein